MKKVMTESQIKENSRLLINLLADRKLKPTFNLLEKLITDTGLGEFQDEYHNLEQTYKYMLKYTVEGINDPERQKVYRHLLVSTFELIDMVIENLRINYSQSYIYTKKRESVRMRIGNFKEYFKDLEDFYLHKELESLVQETILNGTGNAEKDEEHYKNLTKSFYHIWFANILTGNEIEFIRSIFKSDHLPSYEKALIVSAITFSLFRYFDQNKFMLLFEAFEKEEEKIRQRALVGLVVNFYLFDLRIPLYPELTGRLIILNEDPGFKRNLEKIILQFIRSKETEKIQKKLQDEILPEMMKISPNLRNKLNIEGLMGEGGMDDKNPEWEEILSESPGLMDKMEELSELQMEGADVFMSSFSMLKNFPFFGEFANWFVPFYPEHPEIIKAGAVSDLSNSKFIKAIVDSPLLCNSDKYSFCLSLQNITEEYKKMMTQSLQAELDQVKEIEKDEEIISPERKGEVASNQYIQDLYRLFKLNPHRGEFEDIFSWSFDFHNKKGFRDILREDRKLLRNIAEYNFAKNYYQEAVDIYLFLLEEKDDGEILQKTAFCYQKRGDYKRALDYYLKAEFYDLNKSWNLRKIALCYRNLKQHDKALEYYKQAERLDPENLGIHVSIGQCYLDMEEYEKALKCYFKVEYLSPGNKKVWRPIGWCSLLVGKSEQALKYYEKLIEDQPNKYDLMNMGHVQWCLGNRIVALDYYKRSINDADNSEKEFMEAFSEDQQHLIEQGVDADDIPIMLDQLRYSLEE